MGKRVKAFFGIERQARLKLPMREQYNFLRSLDHGRFLELRRICGAEQGQKVNRNQLLDAFHLWCAEFNRCEYFLSLAARGRSLPNM